MPLPRSLSHRLSVVVVVVVAAHRRQYSTNSCNIRKRTVLLEGLALREQRLHLLAVGERLGGRLRRVDHVGDGGGQRARARQQQFLRRRIGHLALHCVCVCVCVCV
jgi:hypothetical protein